MDDAFCGGPDLPSLNSTGRRLVSAAVAKRTVAIILMGNPRHVDGLPFNVGNATAGGVSTYYLIRLGSASYSVKHPRACYVESERY
jgi:hypothetical protein